MKAGVPQVLLTLVMNVKQGMKARMSQGGQVGYVLDFHPCTPGLTPARGYIQKNKLVRLKNDHKLQRVL